MQKKRIILFFCMLCINLCWLKAINVDSVLRVYKDPKSPRQKVDAGNALFLEYEFSEPDKAEEYLNNALHLAKEINYPKGLARTYYYMGYFAEDNANYADALKNFFSCYSISKSIKDKDLMASATNSIGTIYYVQGNHTLALKYFTRSLKLNESIPQANGSIGHPDGIASSYNNIGNVHYSLGNYPEALTNFFASLKIREKTGNKKGLASCYNNIGNLYSDQENHQGALKVLFKCLKINKEIDHKSSIVTCYNNLGVVYTNMGEYDKALENHLASLNLALSIGQKQGIGDSYNNIGLIYLNKALKIKDSDQKKEELAKALTNFIASLKIREELGTKPGIADSYGNIGLVYVKQKKFREAKEFALKAKKIALEIGYKECLKNAYSSIASTDSAIGNFKNAFENHKLYILYRDSIDNEESRKKTIQSQMTYDFEKKEAVAKAEHKKEIENQKILANEKNRKQTIVMMFVLGGLIFVAVFAVFIFRSLRITRKQKSIIEKQKEIVEQQKHEVTLQKELVEEKQKEVMDSIHYAKRIQMALFPQAQYISKNLNRLEKG